MSGRRRWRSVLAAAVAVAAWGCGNGAGDADDAGPSPSSTEPAPPPTNGRIVLVSEDGRLTSVQPDGTGRRDIDGPAVENRGGIRLHAPGIAFFQSTGDRPQLVIVDTEANKATGLLPIEPHYLGPALGLVTEGGGGRRFAVFPSGSGKGGAVLVDIEERKAIPVRDERDPKAPLFTFHLSPDERHLIAAGDATLLIPTGDPDDAQALPSELVGPVFAPDGKTLFAFRAGREGDFAVVRAALDGGDQEVLAEGSDVRLLGRAGDSAVVLEGTEVFLTEKPGDRRSLSSGVTEDQDLVLAAPGPTGRTVAEIRTEDEELDETSAWAVIDSTASSLVAHPELDGFHFVSSDEASLVLANVDLRETRDPIQGPVTLAIIDTDTGGVKTRTFDVPEGSRPAVLQSPAGPDATAVTLTRTGSPVTLILGTGAPVEIPGLAIEWAPDGSALVVIRSVDDQPNAVVVGLDGAVRAELGPAFDAVWVPG